MPQQEPNRQHQAESCKFVINATIFGPIRPVQALIGETQRARKGYISGREVYTDITINQGQRGGGMSVEYNVTANSPKSADRVGAVYLSQLCDLLSAITQSPVWFYMPDEDSRDERIRLHRRSTTRER